MKDKENQEPEEQATEVENETTVEQENETTSNEEQADATTKEASPADEIAALNEKYLRLYSEFENFRRRTAKERIELIGTASSDLMVELLPILDDFDRAIQANETNEDLKAVKEGFTLIHNKVVRILEQKGLKMMKAVNETFDPELHEAVTNIPAPSKKLKGKNVDVIEKGYYLNDKVLRYAKVVVGQ